MPVEPILLKRSAIMHAVLNKVANGITVCYSEVFLNQNYFHLEYAGSLFLVADSYCMNPNCACQEVVLNFVQVFPTEERETNSFMIRYKLNGRGYKIHDKGKFSRREIQAFVRKFLADDSMLKLFNSRYNEMKEKAIELIG